MAAITDHVTTLSDAQALTASAASTNAFDMGDANHQFGQTNERIRLVVRVNTTFSGSATSFDFALQDSADDSTYNDTGIKLSGVAVAKCVTGALVMAVQFPETGGAAQVANWFGAPMPGPTPVRRYIKMYYTLNGGGLAAGKVDAFLETF